MRPSTHTHLVDMKQVGFRVFNFMWHPKLRLLVRLSTFEHKTFAVHLLNSLRVCGYLRSFEQPELFEEPTPARQSIQFRVEALNQLYRYAIILHIYIILYIYIYYK